MGKNLGQFTKKDVKCEIKMREKFNIIHKENFKVKYTHTHTHTHTHTLERLKFKSLLTANVGQDS